MKNSNKKITLIFSILLFTSNLAHAAPNEKKIRGTMLFVNEKSQGFKLNENPNMFIKINKNESLTIFFYDGSYRVINGPYAGSIIKNLKNNAKENSFVNRISGLFAKAVSNSKTIGAVREDEKKPLQILEKLGKNEIGFVDNGKFEISLKNQCIIANRKTKLWDLDFIADDEIKIEYQNKIENITLITSEPRYYIPASFISSNGNLKISKPNQVQFNINLIALSEDEFAKQSVNDFLQKDCQLQAYLKALEEVKLQIK